MPFKSEKQRRWMWANKKKMAKEWEEETPENANLPEEAPKTASAFIGGFLDELDKVARSMPHFTEQNRDPRAKKFYRKFKKEHPEWSAGKKAKISEALANEVEMGKGDQPGGIRYPRKK